jgi:hypothetical protein
VVLLATIYRPPDTLVVYHSLDGDYGLPGSGGDLRELPTIVWGGCLLGDFNVDLLDPGHPLFPRFLDFLEMFMLCNVAIFPSEESSVG